MRKPLALVALSALLIATGVFSASAVAGDPPARAAATKTVSVKDNYFRAKTLKVRKGTIVKWVWRGEDGATETDTEHDVYSTKGTKLRSGFKTTGSYRKRIYKTTRYLCRVHATTMTGKITVVNP